MLRAVACAAVVALTGLSLSAGALAFDLRFVERPPDPHGSPRPAREARDVPLRASFYFELATAKESKGDSVDTDSVTFSLEGPGQAPLALLAPGRRFGEGVSGWLRPNQDLQGNVSLSVYLEPGRPLRPSTTYTARVTARSLKGDSLPDAQASWSFTTEPEAGTRSIALPLDLNTEPVRWEGAFFSGLCNVIFCSQARSYGPTYDLMAEARGRHPRAWSYQRDFWMTGFEDTKPGFLAQNLPNIVRELETRRIAAIEPHDGGLRLRVEDFFGHEQYGIPAGRQVAEDYHAGDEVLIADGVHAARTRVRSAGEPAGTLLVDLVPEPAGGWKLAYDGPLPTRENPDAPGLFAPGGCYLRKFRPHGTPRYYWGRLDKEWDLVHRRGGRRIMVNYADAPGDLAIDGRSWTTSKDLVEWHDVARDMTLHLIDRYGDDALTFTYSVFNEPDLGPLFWRTDWDELQRFYDYAVDGILRAFEERGYDSNRVFVGGLELGGIFGTNLKLREFLAHCSPTAQAPNALPKNAAVADPRLDGRRSRRVESLCGAHAGKGTPCDFVSVHSYNRSEVMAAKLVRAKEMALEIDPDFYKGLWVNSHESCPDWSPPPDQAAADSYLGNGYFATWCVDVVARQLQQAARDPRFAFGETILTVWPPPSGFNGSNAVTRILNVRDGNGPRNVTVPYPEFHVLGHLSDLGPRYWVLPTSREGAHDVGGFASRGADGKVRVILYSHAAPDTQSRSEAEFEVVLRIQGLGHSEPVEIEEHRFDREYNSYFRKARTLLDRNIPDALELPGLLRRLEDKDPAIQRETLAAIQKLGASGRSALPLLFRLAGEATDAGVRQAAAGAAFVVAAPPAYSREEVDEIRRLAEDRPTASARVQSAPEGRLEVKARVASNGLNVLILRPAGR